MPEIWVKVKFRGEKGEVDALALAGSGADCVVWTKFGGFFVTQVGTQNTEYELK